jgi:DNA-binding transcriptional LysR family regulator
MQWDDLKYFLAVARTGQIARAAQSIGADATTVGRRLRRLETTLGTTLFEQQRDGQRLTEAGERLLAQVEAIDGAMAGIARHDSPGLGPDGLVRVSASEGFGSRMIAPRLGDFSDIYPQVQVDLVANSGFLNPSRRETDVAIVLTRPRKGPLVVRKLTDYGLRLFASHAYLEKRPPIATPAQLGQHRLIGYIPDFVYAPELDYLEEIAVHLKPSLRSSSINAQHAMASAGHGIAVLPCFIGDADPALERILPMIRIQRSFWLVAHKDVLMQPRIRVFVDWLIEIASADRERLLGL